MEQKKILFRADAKPTLGTGDLMSLVHLSQSFKSLGWEIHFLIRNYETARKIMSDYKIDHHYVLPEATAQEEVDKINHYCSKNRIKYFFTCITERRLTDYSGLSPHLIKGCVNFDGIISHEWDVVVNWDVIATTLYRREEYPQTKFFLGPEYVILPFDFDWERIRVRTYNEIPHVLLIALGGADEFNFIQKLVYVLDEIHCPLQLRIILGPGYQSENILLRTLKESTLRYEIIKNVKNMFQMYIEADIAIGSGGLISSELVATRTPSLLISLYDHQVARCMFFNMRGLAIYLGHREEALFSKKVEQGIKGLLEISKNNNGIPTFTFTQTAIVDYLTRLERPKVKCEIRS